MATLANIMPNPAGPDFVQYTITGTATRLSTLLAAGAVPARKLTVKNADGAANVCYLGSSNVAATPVGAGVELGAGDSFTFEEQSAGAIWIVGTAAAGNIAFVVAEY
jgi:hypothetical protein